MTVLTGSVIVSLCFLHFVTSNFWTKTDSQDYIYYTRLPHKRMEYKTKFLGHKHISQKATHASEHTSRSDSHIPNQTLQIGAGNDDQTILANSHVFKRPSKDISSRSKEFSMGMSYVVQHIRMKHPFVFKHFLLNDPFFSRYIISKSKVNNSDDCKPNHSQEVFKSFTTTQTCIAKTNIAFLKVHKCGSTTVTNILQRFAIKRNLNVALPLKPKNEFLNNIFGYNTFFRKDMIIPVPKGQSFNMIFNHIVYNKQLFREIFPKNTFYFAIVREPATRFMSSVNYFNIAKEVYTVPGGKRKLSMEISKSMSDLTLGKLYYLGIHKLLRNTSLLSDIRLLKYTFNGVAYDFGIPLRKMNDLDFVQGYIKELEKDFHLVMVMEHFDVSLILLKRRLCWKHKDILYVQHLSSKYIISVQDLTPEDLRLLEGHQKPDAMIYNHFNETLWRHVEEEGPDFFDEVRTFISTRIAVNKFCAGNSSRPLCINATKWNEQFSVTRRECIQMISLETTLHNRLVELAVKKVKHQEEPGFLNRFTHYFTKWWKE